MKLALLAAMGVALGFSSASSALTLEEAVNRTVGQYSTAPQALGGKGKLSHVYVTRVAVPKIGPIALYLEWHEPDANGPVASQRIWSFHQTDKGVKMKFYTLKDSADKILRGVHKAGDGDAKAIAALSLDDLNGYPEACDFNMTLSEYILGGNNGNQCFIYNRRLKMEMRPEVILSFQQAGFIEDGIFNYESIGKRERIYSEFMRLP